MNPSTQSYKSGFVTLIGRPNVGKSTLLNSLLGQKIAIMSDKAQTTRSQIRGIHQEEDGQIIFIDTPGMQDPRNKLGESMLKASRSSIGDADIIVYLTDDVKSLGRIEKNLTELMAKITDKPKILVINKIDQLSQEQLLEGMKRYGELAIFDEIVPVSALKGSGQKELLQIIKKYLPYGPRYFPAGTVTDQPQAVLVSEIIREKILHYTSEEIPHGIAVSVESMKPRAGKKMIDIEAVIYCERENHKKMIIGKDGHKIKGIGKAAREELELLLQSPVFLQLWVRVKQNWREHEADVRRFGLSAELRE